MISSAKPSGNLRHPAFSLVEMVAVIAVIVILLTAGVSVLGGTGAQARRAATDQLMGMIEQARTTAITSRSTVILAVAEPGDLPAGDERCRLGLFRVEGDWTPGSSTPVEAVLLRRWRTLESGVVLIGGQVDGAENPMDKSGEITVSYKTNKAYTITVNALAFNSRGGLIHPVGSAPVAMRVAEGAYRNGKASPNKRANSDGIPESRLKVGRVTARPYRID